MDTKPIQVYKPRFINRWHQRHQSLNLTLNFIIIMDHFEYEHDESNTNNIAGVDISDDIFSFLIIACDLENRSRSPIFEFHLEFNHIDH